MAYTTINKSGDYFNTKLYTGGSGDTAHTGVGFQPDFVWIKNRTQTDNHALFDAIRGSRSWIGSNTTDAQDTSGSAYLVSFDSDGFTTTDTDVVGKNGETYASWNWKANGAGSTNTDGDINSTVSVNTTAGFSIVKFTGNGSSNQSIGHGLNAIPKVIMLKQTSGTEHWAVYHAGTTANKQLYLNLTNAEETSQFGSSAHTSSVFYVGSNIMVNGSGSTYIAYCFAEKTGYSKFGSYVGNGNADGTFIYTGFKPAFVMIKSSSNSSTWHLADNKRIGYNPLNYRLQPNNSNVEYTDVEIYSDFLSNGFKLRNTDTDTNGSGRTYIYMAFAKAPLVGSNNVPANAR